MFRPQMKYNLWRFFTYHIIHIEQTHLFLNVVAQVRYPMNVHYTVTVLLQVETVVINEKRLCIRLLCGILSFQLFVGLTLETEQGHLRILFVYVCGVLAGAIGSMLVNPTQTIYGSSAAVYSLLFSNLSHCLLVGDLKCLYFTDQMTFYHTLRLISFSIFLSGTFSSLLFRQNWSSISMRIFRIIAVLMLFGSDVLVSVLRHMQWIQLVPKVKFSGPFERRTSRINFWPIGFCQM